MPHGTKPNRRLSVRFFYYLSNVAKETVLTTVKNYVFFSFNLNYYKSEIERIETSSIDEQTIYRAKQLLKISDDLSDEGYFELRDLIEKSFRGVSRLREFIIANRSEPFSMPSKTFSETEIEYDLTEVKLDDVIDELITSALRCQTELDDKFLNELVEFCEWIGYDDNTAYVFLFRDTLLPYVYYRNKGRNNIYPWLIGRKTLAWLSDNANLDDELRSSIYNALELGITDFTSFGEVVFPEMRATLNGYPKVKKCLNDLLNGIEKDKIVVIEAGCSGTFPMLLMSMDSRVDFRMYTTYPYLLEVYRDKVFTSKYEENRIFETLYSQDLYLRFSSIKDNCFYVKKCLDKSVQNRSYQEVKTILRLSSTK